MEAEKLCKILEALLKDSANANNADGGGNSPGGPNSKRHNFIRRRPLSKYPSAREEKIHLCNHIADCLSTAAPKHPKEFPDVLGLALDNILTCCNDTDANTRLAAEEVLNRVLQDHIAAHPVTILVDLFKHVKRNEEARCVKAAWSRFAQFALYIRPQRFRCRAFVLNLIPCILQLSRRDEDLIHESLTEGLPLVLKALGPFITETEIRSLVRAFLPNLSAESSVKRRTAATGVVELCMQSRKPAPAIEWLLRGLLGLVRSAADNASSASFCGILLALKNALTVGIEKNLDGLPIPEISLPLQVQILSTLLDCCSNSDHNVQGFALETLGKFLRQPTGPIRALLCQAGGLANFQHSPGDSGDSFEFGRNDSPVPGSPISRDHPDIFDPETFGSVDNPMLARKRTSVDDRSDTVSIISSAMSEDVLGSRDVEEDMHLGTDDEESPSTELADTFSEGAYTDKDVETGLVGAGLGSSDDLEECGFTRIGSLFDVERSSVEYIARFICAKFLLTDGTPAQIRPSVRASVQSVALSCLTDLVKLEPSLLFQSRFLNSDSDHTDGTLIASVFIFVDHSDPLLKACGAVLACLLCTATVNPLLTLPPDFAIDVEVFLSKTTRILRQESAAACRLAVDALESCVGLFMFTEDSVQHALDVVWEVVALLTDPNISYWLLKTELLRFLRAVPFTHLLYIESVRRSAKSLRRKMGLRDAVLLCLLDYLGHEDQRLRHAAAETLTWLPYSLGLPVLVSQQTFSLMRADYEKCLKLSRPDMVHSIQTGLCFPYNAHELPRFVSGVEDTVALIIGRLFDRLICSMNKKDLTAGIVYCLCLLSRNYPTSSYSRSWFGVVEETDFSTCPSVGLLTRISEIMTSSSCASDLQFQAQALELIGNLFAGMAMTVCSVRTKPDGQAFGHIGCRALRLLADDLFRHLAKLLNIVKAATDGQKAADLFSSKSLLSSSPGSTLSLRRRHDSGKRGEKKSKLPSLDLRGKSQLGALNNGADVYGALLEAVKKAHFRNRTHLSHDGNRFQQLIRSTLVCISQLLEMTASDFMAPHTDEMMRYLRVTMDVEGQASVYCVEQLLRCLFGCNLAQMDSTNFLKDVRAHFVPMSFSSELLVAFAETSSVGVFLPRFMQSTVQQTANGQMEEWSSRWNNSLENHRIECLELLFKSYTKEKRVIMSETIRQFESVVIKSLQLYTCTVECGAQVQVLDLLVLLLQLHVNYNVLDGDHVFLKYILKQLELLEMGQLATSQKLLLYLFRFLIHLSHDKVIFQQNILTYGHIVQYCDSLMAITAPSQKVVVPILRLLFDDAIHRRTINSLAAPGEREAQMEVILSTALRCLPEPNAVDIIQKFLMHQLAKSAGLYETHVKDMVETIFQRIVPASMGSMCLQSFGKDYDKVCSFLSVVGCHELLGSPSFRRFFSELITEVRKPSENNLPALLFFSAIIDQFVSKGVIEPLLKLFQLADRNHPLQDPLTENTEVSAQGFALVITEIFDSLFESNTTEIDPPLQQMLDFIYCNILKTLTSFVQIVDQGPVKMALREIQSSNRLDYSERQHINTACRVAWLQFRYAATGCDLEPRFWNRGIKLPIEDHICEVVWTFVRPERGTVMEPEESRRLITDITGEDASALELSLLHKSNGYEALSLIRSLSSSCRGDEDEVVLRWLLQLFAQPRGLSFLFDLKGDLVRLTQPPSGPEDQPGVLGADEEERFHTAWARENPSELKKVIGTLLRRPMKTGKSFNDASPDDLAWLESVVRRVALTSELDDAAGIARLLAQFDEETVMTVMTDRRFSPSLLRDCLRPQDSATSLAWGRTHPKATALFHAARFAFMQAVKSFVTSDWSSSDGADEWLWSMLAAAFVEYAECVNGSNIDFPAESMDDFMQLILTGFQLLSRTSNPNFIRRRQLQCLLLCLENSSFIAWLRQQDEATLESLISEIHHVLEPPKGTLQEIAKAFPDNADHSEDQQVSQPALSSLHTLITEMAALLDDSDSVLNELEASVILGLSRLPSVADVVRIPPSAYRFGWTCEQATARDPIPIELLQELPILKDFVTRVCRYGWTSRRQFEETWMAFLSVLSSVPIEEASETDEAQHEQTVSSRIAAGRVALRCITSLLLESVLAPRPGNPLRHRTGTPTDRSANRHLDDFSESLNMKKRATSADQWVTHFICRPRRASYFHVTHFGQLDQQHCRWVMGGSPQQSESPTSQTPSVDLRSCLKFVMDLYSHWTSDERLKKLSPYILEEVVKSTLHISNIFHDEKNFRWMYTFVRQVLRIKNVEESLFYGHLIDALGKSLSVIEEDKEAMSTLKKSAESRLTQSLLNRVASSRMLLRLMRQQTPPDGPKTLSWLQNLATTIYEAECRCRIRSADALDLIFTIFASQIDVFVPKAKETINPFSEILLLELRGATNLSFPNLNNLVLILGRYLVDKRVDDGVFREQLMKTGLDVINLPPPRSLSILGLLLTTLDPEHRSGLSNVSISEDGGGSPSIADSHSDPLFVMAMEKMAVVQQRRNKSWGVESEILGTLYLQLLIDKTPLREAINRVMAEFQSCPASSAPSVAELVAKVFFLLKKHHLDSVIEEWIALSLGNFANRSPPGLGIWSLTCLFCAASSDTLSALFPFLRERCGVDDEVLREIFLHSGGLFAQELEVDETRKMFVEAVAGAARKSEVMELFRQDLALLSFGPTSR
ncbi:putative Huntingtin [Hypsibius exemplaris]|uniref:Huntingtin n=1 Tax=Hypsibius exemplaris TaxID=2072580 RepID=A0A1W0X301_HYPEX|nr:putative Huntingtin [Hypsibius exemplaris]